MELTENFLQKIRKSPKNQLKTRHFKKQRLFPNVIFDFRGGRHLKFFHICHRFRVRWGQIDGDCVASAICGQLRKLFAITTAHRSAKEMDDWSIGNQKTTNKRFSCVFCFVLFLIRRAVYIFFCWSLFARYDSRIACNRPKLWFFDYFDVDVSFWKKLICELKMNSKEWIRLNRVELNWIEWNQGSGNWAMTKWRRRARSLDCRPLSDDVISPRASRSISRSASWTNSFTLTPLFPDNCNNNNNNNTINNNFTAN